MTSLRKLMMLLAILAQLIGLGCQTCATLSQKSRHSIDFILPKSREKFSIEVADSAAKRERGLMYRKSLAQKSGMLFIFDKSSHHVFWMKNTFIPLDLIFIDDDFFVVGVIENTVPLSLSRLSIAKSSRYVLELNASTARLAGIKVGQKVEINYD
jgi:uncharacterized membrane protein (UPF0127 family)